LRALPPLEKQGFRSRPDERLGERGDKEPKTNTLDNIGSFIRWSSGEAVLKEDIKPQGLYQKKRETLSRLPKPDHPGGGRALTTKVRWAAEIGSRMRKLEEVRLSRGTKDLQGESSSRRFLQKTKERMKVGKNRLNKN